MKNLKEGKKVIGLIITMSLLILQGLTICICNGQKLTLEDQIIEKPIGYFIYSGKLARPITDHMEYAISKIDGLDFLSWPRTRQLTKLQYLKTLDSVYYQKVVQTQKKCLQIKSYPYRSITRSFSNRYKTGWIDLKQNLLIEYQQLSLQETVSGLPWGITMSFRRDWIQPLIGKTQVTTLMMEKNFAF